MLTDALVAFVPIGGNLSLVGAAGAAIPSTFVYDILGAGVGVAPPNIIGNATLFGSDMGIGGLKPQVEAVIGTALASANGSTLNVAFQGADDTGLAGGYLPGPWQTFVETGPITVAQGTAGTVVARFDFPPAFPANFNPRFLRLLFQVPAAGNFTAGTISSAIVTMVRDDQSNKFAAANYKVA
jgi:hypothetical protein